jgi:hypothetical protein
VEYGAIVDVGFLYLTNLFDGNEFFNNFGRTATFILTTGVRPSHNFYSAALPQKKQLPADAEARSSLAAGSPGAPLTRENGVLSRKDKSWSMNRRQKIAVCILALTLPRVLSDNDGLARTQIR